MMILVTLQIRQQLIIQSNTFWIIQHFQQVLQIQKLLYPIHIFLSKHIYFLAGNNINHNSASIKEVYVY